MRAPQKILALLLSSLILISQAAPAAESFNFLALSDIHFDPFATCYSAEQRPCPMIEKLISAPISQWRTILAAEDTAKPEFLVDTNYVLLEKSLEKAHAAAMQSHPDFVLVLGDFLGHDFRHHYRKYYQRYAANQSMQAYQKFVGKTFEFLNQELTAAFPGTNIFMVVGNNDTYSRNYQSVPGGSFFRDTGGLWSALIVNAGDRSAMRRDFSAGGYYAVNVPAHPGLRLIVLNSVLFSTRSVGRESAQAASAELEWLQQQLQQASDKKQKVLIALHIPQSVDVYATHFLRLFTFQEFWAPEFSERFNHALAAYPATIVGVFSGHLHYDWMQTLALSDHFTLPVITVPSISPVYGNDPAFKVYHFGANDRIENYDTYVYPIHGSGDWTVTRAETPLITEK